MLKPGQRASPGTYLRTQGQHIVHDWPWTERAIAASYCADSIPRLPYASQSSFQRRTLNSKSTVVRWRRLPIHLSLWMLHTDVGRLFRQNLLNATKHPIHTNVNSAPQALPIHTLCWSEWVFADHARQWPCPSKSWSLHCCIADGNKAECWDGRHTQIQNPPGG